MILKRITNVRLVRRARASVTESPLRNGTSGSRSFRLVYSVPGEIVTVPLSGC